MNNFEGRLLYFNYAFPDGCVMKETTIIEIPKKLPLFWDFDFFKPIGNCEVVRDDKGLWISDGELTNTSFKDLLKGESTIGVGGYYRVVSKHWDNFEKAYIIDKCYLASVSLTNRSIYEYYYIQEKGE